MSFFNIGTAELLLIFVVALIVVGPRRLPEIAQSLGKIVRDIRKVSQEFTTEMTRELSVSSDSKGSGTDKKVADQDVSEKPVESLGEIVSDVRTIAQEFTEEVTRELDISLDSEESGTNKKVAGQDVSEKPTRGDQA